MLSYHSNLKTVKFTKAMKEYTEEKLNKLSKFLDDVNTGYVNLKKEGEFLKLEIALQGVRASKSGEDFYSLVIAVVEQLERQIKRYKNLVKGKKRDNFKDFEIEENIIHEYQPIEREKKVNLVELHDLEAIEELELSGHSFHAYYDIDRKAICILYARNDGKYGLIITE